MALVDGQHPAWGDPGSLGRAARLAIGGAVVAGILLRLAFGFLYWTGRPLTLDEQEYLLLARNVAAGLGYAYGVDATAGAHFERPPAYPLFLAGVLLAAGDEKKDGAADASSPAAVKFVQSLAGGIGIGLVGLVTFRVAGARAAVLSAWLAAAYPPLVWIPSYVLTEATYAVLALLVVWWLGKAIDRRSSGAGWPAVAAGVVAGVGVLTREAMVFFLVLAAAWLAWTRRPRVLVLLVAGAAAAVLPWTARNFAVHGTFVLGAPHGGVTFWTGNNPLARGEGDLAANPGMKREQQAFEARHRALTNEERDSLYYREALEYIRRHPIAWLGLEARKLFYAIVPIGRSYRLHSTRYIVASVVPYLALLPFAVLGLVHLARAGRAPGALLVMAGSAFLVSLVFFPQERFRIPVLDPTLIVCAASWWGRQGDGAAGRLAGTPGDAPGDRSRGWSR